MCNKEGGILIYKSEVSIAGNTGIESAGPKMFWRTEEEIRK